MKDSHKKFYCIWEFKKENDSTLNWQKKDEKEKLPSGYFAAVHSPRLKERKKFPVPYRKEWLRNHRLLFSGYLMVNSAFKTSREAPKVNFALYQDKYYRR